MVRHRATATFECATATCALLSLSAAWRGWCGALWPFLDFTRTVGEALRARNDQMVWARALRMRHAWAGKEWALHTWRGWTVSRRRLHPVVRRLARLVEVVRCIRGMQGMRRAARETLRAAMSKLLTRWRNSTR